MSTFSLVDCNNFYASCERAFNPKLEKKPIVVLSNNDGCIISRSNEAKKLGIPMGAPFFKWQSFCATKGVHVFSSNYELYGDMSQRVMSILREYCPKIEIYSIDEAFLILDGIEKHELASHMLMVKNTVKKSTGIPISIGIGETKTLAKIANHIAKNKTSENIFHLDQALKKSMLNEFPVEKIWGVGSQLAKKLKQLAIFTAGQLHDTDPKIIRLQFNVMMERIVQELRGISCIPLESLITPRKQIISSRSFGKPIKSLNELEEAISYYASIACKKLRKQNCSVAAIYVFIETNFFNQKNSYYGNSLCYSFPVPTMDTRSVIRIAKKCVKHLYRENHAYHKAGIILTDLTPNDIKQQDMFNSPEKNNSTLMRSIDLINEKFGKEAIFYCAEGINRPWQMQANKLSSRYTTRWDELLEVKSS